MLKNIGIIRKIDELGRVVLPKELRSTLQIRSGDDLQIYVENNNIILQKYSYMNNSKEESNRLIDSVEDLVDCNIYITDKEHIITKGDLENESLPEKLKSILNERRDYCSLSKESFVLDTVVKEGYFLIKSLVKESTPIGLLILIKQDKITEEDNFFAKILKKIIENR